MKDVTLNHIALLVPSVQKAADYLRSFDIRIGPAQEWEGEGTLEIYVGNTDAQCATLLLMESVKEGAYTRALRKRGPGLHHIAIDVLNLETYIDKLSGSGWLLHPKSLKTIKASRTAWLARPGIPALIEVQERESVDRKPLFIDEIRIPDISQKQLDMFSALGIKQVRTGLHLSVLIQNHEIRFECLV